MQIVTVLNIFSKILVGFALLMLLPVCVGLYFDNPVKPFLRAIAETLIVALFLWGMTQKFVRELRPRDGLLLASLSWLILPIFGSLPLMYQIQNLDFTRAYFEAASGLSSTGASVLTGLDKLPEALHFWRGLLLWLGGMGIIVLYVAILPMLGVGGSQIVKAETPGPMKDSKLTPRIAYTAKALWLVYFGFTTFCGICYYLGGMNMIDAIVHAFSTMALGGFSTHDTGFAYWNSPMLESIAIVFMLISGINYASHFQAIRSASFSPYRWDPETRWYFIVLFIAISFTSLYLWHTNVYKDFSTSLRFSLFNIVAMATTTGFANTDFAAIWPVFIPIGMLLMAAFVSCSGSPGSGIKMIRAIVLFKQIKNELIRVVHPNAHVSIKLSGRVVDPRVVFSILTFFAVYILCILVGTLILSATGMNEVTAFSAIMACFTNAAAGLNDVGPSGNYAHLTAFQTWVLSLMMLLGRLEIFTLLAIITPAFWRK